MLSTSSRSTEGAFGAAALAGQRLSTISSGSLGTQSSLLAAALATAAARGSNTLANHLGLGVRQRAHHLAAAAPQGTAGPLQSSALLSSILAAQSSVATSALAGLRLPQQPPPQHLPATFPYGWGGGGVAVAPRELLVAELAARNELARREQQRLLQVLLTAQPPLQSSSSAGPVHHRLVDEKNQNVKTS